MTNTMKSIHILLIEDNEGDIVLTKEALLDCKIVNTISVVRDGWEAIQYLEKIELFSESQTPDIIFLDINLPKMDGHQVLNRIKLNHHIKKVPVVIITTSLSERDKLNSYSDIVTSFITKPIEEFDLLKAFSAIESFGLNIVQLPLKSISHEA